MRYVYLIQCNEFYKIGIASDMARRLAELQIGNPYPLKVVAYFRFDNPGAIESRLHLRFHRNAHGGEWFKFDETEAKKVCDDLVQLGGRTDAAFCHTAARSEPKNSTSIRPFTTKKMKHKFRQFVPEIVPVGNRSEAQPA